MWKAFFQVVLGYIVDTLVTLVKKAIPTLEAIVIEEAKIRLEKAEEFLHGETFDEAKAKLVDMAFEKIKLPLIVRPFKGLIKKGIMSRVDSALEKLLADVKEKLKK